MVRITDLENWVTRKWNSRWAGIPLWFIGAWLVGRWYFVLPTPGKAVGALAVVAGLMSVREMKVLGKIAWVVLLICMVLTEFRAIDDDHADSDRKQKAFFEAQKRGFEGVTKQAQTNFATTAAGLTQAVAGLRTTIGFATQTFDQTRPHATILPTSYEVTNPPAMGGMFDSKTVYNVNFYFANEGSEQGWIAKRLGRIYVQKPDDRLAEDEFARAFENDWKAVPSSLATSFPAVSPGLPPTFWTEQLTITSQDEAKLKVDRETIYFVRRIQYRDQTGTWWSERCDALQIQGNTMDMNISHPCLVLNTDPSKAKRH